MKAVSSRTWRIYRSLALCSLLAVSACSQAPNTSRLDARVAELSQKLDAAEKEIADQHASIIKLESGVRFRDTLQEMNGVAYLSPGSDGYSVIEMDMGKVTISLENVEPYANGTRATLQIGNPTMATLAQSQFTVEWGKVDAKGVQVDDSLKTKEVKLSKDIQAGAWNRAQVVLDGVPPADLGFVRIKDFAHASTSLRKTF